MCMMAGYNGTKRAAPILIEMLRKEEGINAGCFTGIATLHEGKIYYRKLAGNLDRLLAETDAMDLPGSIGIIHSRTPNGVPVDSWAHPFTCEQDGRVRTALMLNGMNGCCNELNLKQYPTVLKKIKEAGYPLKSEADIPKDRILKHPKDGNKVYQKTDCLAQLASMRILEEGTTPAEALQKTVRELPGENMILMLSDTAPDVISWCRVNFPMYIGLTDHGVCMASAPIAFAEHTSQYTLLPALSAGEVTRESFTVKKIMDFPYTVAPITPKVVHDAYEAISKQIQGGNDHFSKIVKPLFEEADCNQSNAITWAVLSDLHRQGKIDIEKVLRPGVREELFRTQFHYVWKD
ncbi:MAG: hypothetical protein IKM48_00665 [Clostridia bacterium]|nr:hypothetical protein [Clostridia bacterium]